MLSYISDDYTYELEGNIMRDSFICPIVAGLWNMIPAIAVIYVTPVVTLSGKMVQKISVPWI